MRTAFMDLALADPPFGSTKPVDCAADLPEFFPALRCSLHRHDPGCVVGEHRQVSFHLHSTAFFSIIWSGLIDARRDLWIYFGLVFAHRLFSHDMRAMLSSSLRYEKRHSNIPAHISPCFRVKEGDHVIIGQCR
ncbi:hypothetical protein BHM03_00008566 [Ensete ventricosum]|nr:hypothetical protein BHM03_00008566 [Ensete ventricosum]